ncbi:MAG TPA: phospholipase D-like domain-containing protein [Chloroflexota bacterium]|nr:phospholipase D-like domain-containing protein [Chloroflexota bacterium]HZS89602.1 phospholipase D-like domain-containing protein [Chloroflexota bacterium]
MAITRSRSLYVTPDDDAHAALIAAAQAATTSLHLSIYGFTLADLGQIFIDKKAAGLSVGIVVDKTQAAGPKQHALLQRLVDNGVPVTIATSPTGAINHEKCLLVDLELGADHNESYACYGSFNFSDSAEKQENHLCVDNDPTVCALFWRQYQETEAYGKAHCTQLSPTHGP